MATAINVSKAILDILEEQNKPIEIDELAFRIRTTPSRIYEILNRLKEAKVVKQKNDGTITQPHAFYSNLYHYTFF